MAYTEQVQQDLIGLMVGMFDAAPGQVIFNDVADAYRAGADYTAIADTLAGSDEFKSIYGSNLTDTQFVTRLVNNMLDGHVSDQDEIQDVIDLFVVEMNAGATRGQVALSAAVALRDVDANDPVFGQASVAFNNKIDVATYYSIDAAQNGNDLAELQAVLAGVDHTDASVDAARDAIDGTGTGGGEGGNIWLEIGRDNEVGTAGDDRFIADVVQSQNGALVNTLGSGDRLDGGAGTDTLQAQVVHGTNYGGTNTAISARTQNIENIELEARNSDLGNDQSTVFVNASEMHGIDRIGSEYSDANLVIQNLTTYDTTGANGRGADPRLPSDLTITMSHTGGRNSNWDESDLHVFFAQNNLRPDVDTDTSASQANYWLADQDSDNFGAEPLQNIDRDGILFTLNGKPHGIQPDDEVLLDANTWEEFAEGLREELAAMVAAGNTDLAGIEIIVDADNSRQTYTDSGKLIAVHAITLVDSNGGVFSDLGFTIPQNITGEFNVYGRVSTLAPETSTSEIISTNIELEKVGRGTDGGELVIGGMDKGYNLNFYNGVQGIEQFNVTVIGGEELPNSLSALRSTNNQLQIVNIVSDAQGADSFAGLQIGKENSTGYGLKDVRVVNAQDFDGDLSISAEITTESFAKYVDLFDGVGDAGHDPAADNVYFDYNLTGEGDNALWLDVDMGLAAHEDFVLSVLTDGGDDVVVVRLDADNSFTQNQYNNQSSLDNVTIGTGAGDDVIWTPGNGDVTINAGSGNDTVYTDNSASQDLVNAHLYANSDYTNNDSLNAHWVTNSVNTNIHDLEGGTAGDSHFLYGAKLTVTLAGVAGVTSGSAVATDNGLEATVDIPTTNGYVGNHTHINQAIKDAINNDSVLNKLLVAKDGPGNSVIIESLIDGEFAANDLSITIATPSATALGNLNAGQTQQLNNAWGAYLGNSNAPAVTAADLVAEVAALETDYAGIGAGNSRLATDGELSAGLPAVAEIQELDFAGFGVTTAGDIDVGGIWVTLNAGDDGAAIATAVATAINNQILANSTANVTATANDTVVEITYHTNDANVAPVTLADGTADLETNLVPVGETQTIDFGGNPATITAAGNFGIGGILVNVPAGATPQQMADATVAAINGKVLSAPLGTVTAEVDPNDNEVVIVSFSAADGNVAAITVAPGSSGLAGAVVADNVTPYDPFGSGDAAQASDVPVTTVTDGAAAIPAVTTGVDITGENSDAQTDNVINLGTGQDVVVLSTSDDANETIVWTGHNTGKNTIVNFSESGNSIDQIDFSAYLNGQASAHSSGAVAANDVVVTSFASLGTTGSVTWDNLSASSLETALNASSSWSGANSGSTVFMIENGDNEGEYQIFDVALTSSGFDVVDLIGQADFGASLTLTDVNFA